VSGTGRPGDDAPLDATGTRLAIVAARWHGDVVDALLAGANEAARDSGARVATYRVPGAFEIPVVAAAVARRDDVDAVVALGVVMRGGTPHFDYVCRAVTDGCLRVSLDSGKPVGFGVLTVDDEQQAKERLDKGREAVRAVLETLVTLDRVR
jgi:6,7-dimethyl-8-ribityllumazine synthase